jgi:L-serine dehydratase
MYTFKTAKELTNLCKKHKVNIAEIAIRYETEYEQKERSEILVKMRRNKKVMREAVRQGIKNSRKSVFGMSGGDAAKLYRAIRRKKMASSKLVLKAMTYAVATGETNAAMGRISAFPTAGGAGVVPGVLLAAAEEWKLSEQRILKGLFTSAAIGKIIAEGATLSAAAGGCQAEVGAATAMAAAGLTEMRKGTPQQCINASAIALKSYLGLVCDPLGGLVAVPCIKRNMLGASVACAASDATLVGIKSFIPFDEVVEAMNNVAKTMSYKLRETALGGLAVTETGLKIRKKMGLKHLSKKEISESG